MNLLTSFSVMNSLPYSDSSQKLLHIKITQGALGGRKMLLPDMD